MVVLINFGGNIFFPSKILWQYNVQKNSMYVNYVQLCHIINVFTVTFVQFNTSLLNKSFNFLLFLSTLLKIKVLHDAI